MANKQPKEFHSISLPKTKFLTNQSITLCGVRSQQQIHMSQGLFLGCNLANPLWTITHKCLFFTHHVVVLSDSRMGKCASTIFLYLWPYAAAPIRQPVMYNQASLWYWSVTIWKSMITIPTNIGDKYSTVVSEGKLRLFLHVQHNLQCRVCRLFLEHATNAFVLPFLSTLPQKSIKI